MPDLAATLGVDAWNGKCVHDDNTTQATRAIIKNRDAGIPTQAILICTVNGPYATPSMYILPRTNSIEVVAIHEGSVKKNQISIDSSGNVTVSGLSGFHFYYRVFNMELNA